MKRQRIAAALLAVTILAGTAEPAAAAPQPEPSKTRPEPGRSGRSEPSDPSGSADSTGRPRPSGPSASTGPAASATPGRHPKPSQAPSHSPDPRPRPSGPGSPSGGPDPSSSSPGPSGPDPSASSPSSPSSPSPSSAPDQPDPGRPDPGDPADPAPDSTPPPWADAPEPLRSRYTTLAERLKEHRDRIAYLAEVIDQARADLGVAASELDTASDADPAKSGPALRRWQALGAILSAAEVERRTLEDEAEALSTEIDRGSGLLALPVRAPVSSGFGVRFDPYYHRHQVHEGLDLAAGYGTTIHAAADGTVVFSGTSGGYGILTCIAHGSFQEQSLWTCYGHQSRSDVRVGERVHAGQAIGAVGSTGASTGPHLHFEVRVGGRAVDPAPWLGLRSAAP